MLTSTKAATEDNSIRRWLDGIAAMGLTEHLVELETQGYTVVPGVLSQDTIDRAKEAILKRVERKTNRKIDPENATAANFNGMQYIPYMLFDDPVFEEILMEPRPLALITHLLGETCLLSSLGCHFRGPGGMPLGVHSDTGGPTPFSSTSIVANCNYALTPYSREGGALTMFPGSHKLQRRPTPHENFMAGDLTIEEVMAKKLEPTALDALEWTEPKGSVCMDIAPGDAVISHGNTWHGGFKRDVNGVRMNLAAYFCRDHISTQERRGDERYQHVLDRHADEPRFATLLGTRVFNGWREEGPDYSRRAMP